MNEVALRGCPLCGTPVDDVDLGLRDYRWLEDALPGRVAPTDVDFMLETAGHVLILEYKPLGVYLPLGQRLTFKTLVLKGIDVWLVRHNEDSTRVKVGAMDRNGEVVFSESMPVSRLKRKVREWFDAARQEVA